MSASNPDIKQAAGAWVAASATGLHGIGTRTEGEHIAAELLRLNGKIRAVSDGQLSYHDQPADYAARLLARADQSNSGGAQP